MRHAETHHGCQTFRLLTRQWCITRALELIDQDPRAGWPPTGPNALHTNATDPHTGPRPRPSPASPAVTKAARPRGQSPIGFPHLRSVAMRIRIFHNPIVQRVIDGEPQL